MKFIKKSAAEPRLAAGVAVLGLCAGAALAQDAYVVTTPGIDGIAPNAEAQAMLPEGRDDLSFVTFVNVPFSGVDAEGALTGAAVDLSAAVAAVLGVELKIGRVNDVATSKVTVQSGRFDVSTGPLIDTPTSEKDMAIIPWVKTLPGFVFRAGEDYAAIMDFCGTKVSYVSGSRPAEANLAAMSEACKAQGSEAPEGSGFASQDAIILSVLGGRADVALVGAPTALYMAKTRPDQLAGLASEDDIFGVGLYSGVGLAPDDDSLAPAVLAAMQVLMEDGQYAAILAEYGLEPLAVETFAINPLTSR